MMENNTPIFEKCRHTHEMSIDRGTPNSLVLIRGLPGSGKSTFYRNRFPSFVHYEADMYHMVHGKYEFSTDKLSEAHRWCRESAFVSLHNFNNVVVSNTFTTLFELRPYLDMPFNVWVLKMEGNFDSVHNVPDHAIEKMKNRWESLDDYESMDGGVVTRPNRTFE